MSDMLVKCVTDAQNGDIDAFAKLYSRTLKSSYFLALKLTADDEKAVEITKKAYATAFCTIENLKKPEAFEIWIKQTVANAYKATQNFNFGDADATVAAQPPEFLPEYVFGDGVLARRLEQAVALLPAVQRAAVVLFYNNGMPVIALSRYLGVSESTAGALLMKARRTLMEALGSPQGALSSEKLPVLTRVFMRSASEINIAPAAVKEIFIYASSEYDKQLASSASEPESDKEPKLPATVTAYAPEAEAAPDVKPAPEPEQEPVSEPEPEPVKEEEIVPEPAPPAPEIKPEPEKPAENDLSFFDREPAKVAQELIGSLSSDSDNEGRDAIEEIKNSIAIETPQDESNGISFEGYQGISSLTKPADDSSDKPKSSKAKVIIIAAVAVLIVAVVIALVLALGNRNDNGETVPGETTTQSAQGVTSAEYVWTPGGFEKYSDIQYFNEYACKVKSASTGLYGLMDYRGKILLEPTYADFTRCSNGKDYTGKNSYHYLVQIEAAEGSPKYELTFTDSAVNISTTAHTQHASDTDVLDSNDYDERDRYFEGYAAARKDGKWGYVSKDKDKKVIPFEYEAVNNLSTAESACADYCRAVNGGLAAVKKNGIMGIIDLKNNEVVPFEYSNILQGSNGVFIACKAGTWGIITVGDAITGFDGIGGETTTLTPEQLDGAEIFVGTYIITAEDGVNVRSNAGASYDKLGELPKDTVVVTSVKKTADNGKSWVCIDFEGGTGWISMTYLKKAPAGATASAVTTTAPPANALTNA